MIIGQELWIFYNDHISELRSNLSWQSLEYHLLLEMSYLILRKPENDTSDRLLESGCTGSIKTQSFLLTANNCFMVLGTSF